MKILNAVVKRAHRDRYFGRVEAEVSLLVRDGAQTAPRLETIRANVPVRDGSKKSLRSRLIEDAATMSMLFANVRHMERSNAA